MTKWPSHIDADYLQSFFFEAMQEWCASGFKGEPSHEAGYSCFKHENGPYKLIDTWMSAPAPHGSSHGYTRIWYEKFPLWFMQYNGYYRKEAVPVVHEALALAYNNGKFFGGRGVRYWENEVENGTLIYQNRPDIEYDVFAAFRGNEVVHDHRMMVAGYHHYYGGLIG